MSKNSAHRADRRFSPSRAVPFRYAPTLHQPARTLDARPLFLGAVLAVLTTALAALATFLAGPGGAL